MSSTLNDIGNEAPAYGGASGLIDNCIVQSQVVAGNADFFTVAALNLTLVANATDPFEVSVAGKRVKLTANVVFAVTDTAHNFIFIDQTGALSRVANPCTYAFTAPGGPASGDMWFDLGKNQMKSWNGAAWVVSNKVAIGYVRADGGAINAAYACEPIRMDPYTRFSVFGDGSDGFMNITAGTNSLGRVFQATALIVSGTGAITHSGPNGTAISTIKSQGPVVFLVAAAASFDGKGRGGGAGALAVGAGGGNGAYGGSGGGGGGGTSAGGAGGNQWLTATMAAALGGAAGAALGGAGGAGTATGFPTGGISTNYPTTVGNGGGGGGGDGVAAGGNGGAGGGQINLWAPVITVAAASGITALGINGVAGSAAARGGGGGGGGGIINLYYRNLFNAGTISAAAGTGGAAGGAGAGAGGLGGAGLVVSQRI